MENKSLLAKLRKRWMNNKGQSTTEYILILAIVVMLASKVRKSLTTTVLGTADNIGTQLQQFNSDSP